MSNYSSDNTLENIEYLSNSEWELEQTLLKHPNNNSRLNIMHTLKNLYTTVSTTTSPTRRGTTHMAMATFCACIAWECATPNNQIILYSYRYNSLVHTTVAFAFYNNKHTIYPPPPTQKTYERHNHTTNDNTQWHIWNQYLEASRVNWLINACKLMTEFAEPLNHTRRLEHNTANNNRLCLQTTLNTMDHTAANFIKSILTKEFIEEPTTNNSLFPPSFPYQNFCRIFGDSEEDYMNETEDLSLYLNMVNSTTTNTTTRATMHNLFQQMLQKTLTTINPSQNHL